MTPKAQWPPNMKAAFLAHVPHPSRIVFSSLCSERGRGNSPFPGEEVEEHAKAFLRSMGWEGRCFYREGPDRKGSATGGWVYIFHQRMESFVIG